MWICTAEMTVECENHDETMAALKLAKENGLIVLSMKRMPRSNAGWLLEILSKGNADPEQVFGSGSSQLL